MKPTITRFAAAVVVLLVLVVPLSAEAQPRAQVARVGVIASGSVAASAAPVGAFRERLRELADVARAIDEVPAAAIAGAVIAKRWDLFSRVASTSAGVELHHNEIRVLGNANDSASDLPIAHDVMEDAIDQSAVRRALHAAGCEGAPDRVVGVSAKAEASPPGRIRGRRHVGHWGPHGVRLRGRRTPGAERRWAGGGHRAAGVMAPPFRRPLLSNALPPRRA